MANNGSNLEESVSVDNSSDTDLPHVESGLGFTVYYEISDNTPNTLSEVVVINSENERLDFLEECLMNRKLNLDEGDITVVLLKEAERIFKGDVATASQELDSAHPETPSQTIMCQYFLKGKCRFGDNCFNVHDPQTVVSECSTEKKSEIADNPTSVENKPEIIKSKKKNEKIEKPGKKPPMKTATDVINRIQWDEKLNPENFTVGYLDRFLGVVENTFTSFDWEDVTSLDQTILAIPKHRIQYFKFYDEVVWDKNKRLDFVFGSTGSGRTIVDVMEDSKHENKTVNETQNVDQATYLPIT